MEDEALVQKLSQKSHKERESSHQNNGRFGELGRGENQRIGLHGAIEVIFC